MLSTYAVVVPNVVILLVAWEVFVDCEVPVACAVFVLLAVFDNLSVL